jgi:cyanophycinase
MLALYLLLFPSLAVSQSLVMIGGALNDTNSAIYSKIVELAGGAGAKIGVIATGSPFPIIQGLSTVQVLNSVYNAKASYIHVCKLFPSSNSYIVANIVKQQNGILLLGEDRLRITKILRPNGKDSLVWSAILQVVRNGGVLAANDGAMASLVSRICSFHDISYFT